VIILNMNKDEACLFYRSIVTAAFLVAVLLVVAVAKVKTEIVARDAFIGGAESVGGRCGDHAREGEGGTESERQGSREGFHVA
jgi:hypothetical protein